MSDEEAQHWIAQRYGPAAIPLLQQLIDLVRGESERQNLIAPSTVDRIWTRHVLDSAQLVPLAPVPGIWLDIGTGGGFPGLVVAALRREPTLLVEPRRRRADFLAHCVVELGMTGHVEVKVCKVESVSCHAAVISARAVTSVENLLRAASPCATIATRWLLPRGRLDNAELLHLRQNWRGVFHVEQSLTCAQSSILVLNEVNRR